VLDNSGSNNTPNALIAATRDMTGVCDPHEIGVFYTGGHWAIFNADDAAMPVGAAFDLSVGQPPETSLQNAYIHYIHTTTVANRSGYSAYLNAAVFTTPNLVPRVAQVWTPKGVCSCVLNPKPSGSGTIRGRDAGRSTTWTSRRCQ
jgi:hypothetical protein